jgi:pyridine nucleotide-disulfide oxidoreductase family protein
MKHLLLLGGGHAHVHVLQALAAAPLPAARVTLVSPFARQMYSGMVPGLLAGHYAVDDCVIPLLPLAEAARVRFVPASAVALDAATRRVSLSNGEQIAYDVLSLDTGPVMPVERIPGAERHGWPVRPIEAFIERWQDLLARVASGEAPRIGCVVVVGGGAAGVELAMALQYRLGTGVPVSLVTGGGPVLASHSKRVQALALRALKRCGVTVFEDRCTELTATHLLLSRGMRLACDVPVLALGAAAAPWLARSGLRCDADGFVETGPCLQSLSHPEAFAAGDVAARPDAPHPRSGVYAVRAGPPLALNLRRAVAGGALAPHQPQRRSLALLACGAQRAIAAWGPLSLEAGWVWRWKDHIDRAFIARYRGHGPAPAQAAQGRSAAG